MEIVYGYMSSPFVVDLIYLLCSLYTILVATFLLDSKKKFKVMQVMQ